MSPSMAVKSSSEPSDSDNPFAWVPDQPWMNHAKCRGMHSSVFFGHEYEGRRRHRPSLTSVEVRRAKAVCAVCPVLQECFDFAMENREEYGVWGGTTRSEREDLWAMLEEEGIDQGVFRR